MRRLRGAFVVLLFWAAAWAVIGVGVGIVKWQTHDLIDVGSVPPVVALRIVADIAVGWAALGAINGLVFVAILAFTERTKSVGTLSLIRVVAWGGLAALALPAVVVLLFMRSGDAPDLGPATVQIAISALLGAVCSAVMLVIARRGEGSPNGSAA